MNKTEEAIAILKKQRWVTKINRLDDGRFELHRQGFSSHCPEIYTARELIKLSRVYTHNNNQTTSIKKNVKHFDNAKNRSHTRDAIKTEDWDKIPQNGKTAQDDIWGWD